MSDEVVVSKASLKAELAQLESRCTIIKNLLQSLDAYEHPGAPPPLLAATPKSSTPSVAPQTDGPTVMERAKKALEIIPQPFVLIDLKRKVEQDGLGEIGRGNWGVVVAKLKKKDLIKFESGEEGKPGALYRCPVAVEAVKAAEETFKW